MNTYFIVFDADGLPISGGVTPDGTLPANALGCTKAQAEQYSKWQNSNGNLAPYSPPVPPPTLAEQASAAMGAGVAITSSSTPALNGTYSCDPVAWTKVQGIAQYAEANGKFPARLSQLPWADASGTLHTFTATGTFKEFASKIGDYVTALEMCIIGASTTLPASGASIP